MRDDDYAEPVTKLKKRKSLGFGRLRRRREPVSGDDDDDSAEPFLSHATKSYVYATECEAEARIVCLWNGGPELDSATDVRRHECG
jgi:hypothetical protein